MVFSSTVFLFIYLPVFLLIYLLLPGVRLKNIFLLLASLFFYAWGEQFFVLVMLTSIIFNYLMGMAVAVLSQKEKSKARLVVWFAVAGNLGLLGVYKYANFFLDNLNTLLSFSKINPVEIDAVHLPIGISFFTFQALTYVVDIYRGEADVQKNPLNVGLYISMFPQLIAGPIVRYKTVSRGIKMRKVSFSGFSEGVRVFLIGLGKKMLVANVMAGTADEVFSVSACKMPVSAIWLGVVCYTFQIYYDFSGYSDMAIGLGKMLGFEFPVNFNYPYISRSIREFWQRWHISLSTWFRDYLYIPLGGSRCSAARIAFNLTIVFFLCGLWHGASWNFVIWGLFHGSFIVLERTGYKRHMQRLWVPLQHFYVLIIICIGWVFFRAETMPQAFEYLGRMFSITPSNGVELNFGMLWSTDLALAMMVAVVGALPVFPFLMRVYEGIRAGSNKKLSLAVESGAILLTIMFFGTVLVGTGMLLAKGAHNPFIYFRF